MKATAYIERIKLLDFRGLSEIYYGASRFERFALRVNIRHCQRMNFFIQTPDTSSNQGLVSLLVTIDGSLKVPSPYTNFRGLGVAAVNLFPVIAAYLITLASRHLSNPLLDKSFPELTTLVRQQRPP